MFTRRRFLTTCAASGAVAALGASFGRSFAAEKKQGPWQLGICDWNVQGRGTLDAFANAKNCGFDGVQVSFMPEGEIDLRKQETQKLWMDEAKKHDMQIASLAMGILNSRPFATDPDAEEWVSDCIDIMQAMGQKRVLLAFFGKGDLRGNDAAMKSTIERLKRLAPKAEKADVQLLIESQLNMDDHMRIVDGVASKSVQVYYDVANMTRNGYDIYAELDYLGGKKDVIREIHLKELGNRFGEGVIDFPKVRDKLEEIGYEGWLIGEAGVRGDWIESQKHNSAYVRRVFGIG